ncbi:MAG: DUF2062 domain-containing protein [Hyphomicrobiales bacterium]|nr:DUF2062 domain-containing protein [Hyphomicrobiales bacterium]
MLFRRRVDPHFWERLRIWAWPRHSWRRSFKYLIKRVLRLTATPHAVAAGVAAGVFTSFTPFVGLHITLALVICLLIGGNMAAAVIGTGVGNPLTFPFIWAATYELGRTILGNGSERADPHAITSGLFSSSYETILPIIKPMTVGSIPIGVPFAIGFYFLARSGVRAYQQRRRDRLAEFAQRRNDEIAASLDEDGSRS